MESAYTVNEANDTGLPLCAELRDGILERSVTVMLNSMDGSATTLGKHELNYVKEQWSTCRMTSHLLLS